MPYCAWMLSSLVVFVFMDTAEAAITGWSTPVISGKDGTGKLNVSESQALSETITTYVATANATPVSYSLLNEASPFALSSTGALTITAKLNGEMTPSYILHIQANDSTPLTGTATITVTVTNVNKSPAFGQSSYSTCIADGSPEDASVITVSATEKDKGETVSYSITSNGNTDFKIDDKSGVITVNTGKTLDMTKTPNYSLIVKAIDSNTNAKTGSATVSIEVTADGNCSGGAAIAASIMTLFLSLVVTF